MTEKEVKKIKKVDREQYAILNRRVYYTGHSAFGNSPSTRKRHYKIDLRLLEDEKASKNALWTVQLSYKFPKKDELNKAIIQINRMVEGKKNRKRLEVKTNKN